jgi:hypothetical protein
LAIKMFFKVLFSGRFARRLRAWLAEIAAAEEAEREEEAAEESTEAADDAGVDEAEAVAVEAAAVVVSPESAEAGAVRVLALLQRESRLIDFLMEDISGFSDAQVGAAVRAIHRDCRRALLDALRPTPVLADAEGSAVRIEEGFDPSAIRLTGNLSGGPPFRGVLRHRGWRAGVTNIPAAPAGADPLILAAAEVELVEGGR